MKRQISEPAGSYLGVMAVVLFLAGAAMLFTEISSVIAFAVIAIAAALTVIAFNDTHRRGGNAH